MQNQNQNNQEKQTNMSSQQNYYSPYSQYGSGQQQSMQYQNQQPTSPTTIQNPSTGQLPKVKGPEMNDRDRLNDMLATEKYLTDSFNVFARETSYQELHEDVMTILEQTHYQARDLFNMMFELGWYKLQAESQQQVSQAHQQFQNYQSQFPSNNTQNFF